MTALKSLFISLKFYFIVINLYCMFHIKKKSHQIRIIIFFKSVKKSKKNTLFIIKMQILFSTFLATLIREKITTFQLRKSVNRSFKKYISNLLLKIISKKCFENIIHIASFTYETINFTRFNYDDKRIKISTRRHRHLKKSSC